METLYIREEISKCEDVEELKTKILPMVESQKVQWSKKIKEIIEETGLTKSKFAELCDVSRVSVDKWIKGSIPKNRETFLRIGMVAGYNLDRMNQLLQRYGQYPALYSKSLEDCVCIFVINNTYGTDTIARYQYILKQIKDNIIKSDEAINQDIKTDHFDEKLSQVQDEDELQRFISENSNIFLTTYHRFYAYVKMHIMSNYADYSGSVFEMAEGQGWSSSLRQSVSAIRQNKWYPTRNKIISLGLHLSMDHDQIDEMLSLAHMEPLCAKNIFESVIMFILDDASLNNMLDYESEEFDPDELVRYTRKILESLDMPEVESFISELPEVEEDAW